MYRITCFYIISIFLLSCGKEKEKFYPRYMPLIQAVYASGKIKSFNEYKVYSTASGLLKSRKVSEGDIIHQGQVIAEIQSDVSDIRMNNSRTLLKQAEKNASSDSPVLLELKSQIESAKLKMENDSSNFFRYQNLLKQGIGTKADVDAREVMYKTSKNNYIAAYKRYLTTKDQLDTDYKNASSQAQISYSTKNDFEIRSMISGKVYALYKEMGEMINPQEPVALIGDDKKFIVELSVDELDINKVKAGQKVLITMDTYGEKVFNAVITKIYPLLDSRTQTFTVDAEFVNSPENLFPGLTAEANIVISQSARSLVIPSGFVFPGDSVILEKGTKHKIKSGLRNLEYVEILNGLDSTTAVYKQ
jgi:HlyD family secretion protein